MKSILTLLFAAAVTSAAHAAGFYLKGQALFNNPRDIETSSASAFRASLDDNIGWSAALGYKFSLLRAEAELQRFSQDAERGTSSTGAASVSGGIDQLTGFANAFVDLPSFFGLAPYLGGGLGLARVDLDNLNATQGTASIVQYSGSETAFAWQVAGGLQFHFLGRATIHAGYRIIKHESVSIRNAAAAAVQGIKVGENRTFELGLAIGF